MRHDLSKYTVPTKVMGMLVVSALPTKVVGMQASNQIQEGVQDPFCRVTN